jgi:hypothetical protein
MRRWSGGDVEPLGEFHIITRRSAGLAFVRVLWFLSFFIDATQQVAWLSAQPAMAFNLHADLQIAIGSHQRTARSILRDKLSCTRSIANRCMPRDDKSDVEDI